jgi:hypothetical protein
VPDFERRAHELISELELTGKEHALPGELSRGMRQKVVIACGLSATPRSAVRYEPLTGLDPIGIRRMRDTITRRADLACRRPLVAPAPPRRGSVHARDHHGQRPQGGRRHREGFWRPAPNSPPLIPTSNDSSWRLPGTDAIRSRGPRLMVLATLLHHVVQRQEPAAPAAASAFANRDI